jgi:hypothetical protein
MLSSAEPPRYDDVSALRRLLADSAPVEKPSRDEPEKGRRRSRPPSDASPASVAETPRYEPEGGRRRSRQPPESAPRANVAETPLYVPPSRQRGSRQERNSSEFEPPRYQTISSKDLVDDADHGHETRRKIIRLAARTLLLLGSVVFVIMVPVAAMETVCRAPESTGGKARLAAAPLSATALHRPESGSYLAYPAWYIADAHQDFAGVLAAADASDFDYLGSIGGYWGSLCGVSRSLPAHGGSSSDIAMVDYLAGLSFTVEMALKGVYESTIGRITAAANSDGRTSEDDFALAVANDYAKAQQANPGSPFAYGMRVQQLWEYVPFTSANPLRAVERRVGLTIEWLGKAAWQMLFGGVGDASARPVAIVVRGLDAADAKDDPRIKISDDLGNNLKLIVVQQQRDVAAVIEGLAMKRRDVVEIAGNRAVLASALVPPSAHVEFADTIFWNDIQSKPGWRRLGFDVPVPELTNLIRSLKGQGAVFERVYQD